MTHDDFWALIAASKNGYDLTDPYESQEAQRERLRDYLLQLPIPEVEAFEKLLDERIAQADSRKLWDVAADIQGGCSQDAFDDFRAWLISMGRQIYEAAIKDPDSLYSIAEKIAEASGEEEPCTDFEEFQYIPSQVLRQKRGEED